MQRRPLEAKGRYQQVVHDHLSKRLKFLTLEQHRCDLYRGAFDRKQHDPAYLVTSSLQHEMPTS